MSAYAHRREWLASCDYDLKPHLPFLCAKNSAEAGLSCDLQRRHPAMAKASMKNRQRRAPTASWERL